MWVYRKVTYYTAPPENRAAVVYEVGYVATRESTEYNNGAYFHPVEMYYETKDAPNARTDARKAVHYLNGGML